MLTNCPGLTVVSRGMSSALYLIVKREKLLLKSNEPYPGSQSKQTQA